MVPTRPALSSDHPYRPDSHCHSARSPELDPAGTTVEANGEVAIPAVDEAVTEYLPMTRPGAAAESATAPAGTDAWSWSYRRCGRSPDRASAGSAGSSVPFWQARRVAPHLVLLRAGVATTSGKMTPSPPSSSSFPSSISRCSPSTVGRAWITDVGSDARAAVVSLHGRLGSSRNRPPAYWSSRHSASSQPTGSGTAPSPFARGGSRHPRRCRSRAAADARLTGQAGPSAEPRRTASRAPQMPASGRWEVAGSAGASASSGPGRPATARGRPRDPPAP
jgi:hypothetical protein